MADSRRSDIPRCVTRHRSGRWVAGRGRHSPFRDGGNMDPAALDPGEFDRPSILKSVYCSIAPRTPVMSSLVSVARVT